MTNKRTGGLSVIIAVSLVALTVFVWYEIVFAKPVSEPRIYFLDVGQGDAELAVFPGNVHPHTKRGLILDTLDFLLNPRSGVGVKILTDAGPDKSVLRSMSRAIGGDRYIDIGIISHPQLDHFNGFNYLLDNYRFGAFIFNGRSDSPLNAEWQTLLDKIKSQNIPLITLGAGDKINYSGSEVDFLSPDKNFIQSAELNDTAFVELIKTGGLRTLLTSDTGSNIEDYLVENGAELAADVLKVGHHGSKYSSSEEFLQAVNPEIAVIEVGANNTYGHPAPETLARIASTTAKVFRTDQNGTIEVLADTQKLEVYTEK